MQFNEIQNIFKKKNKLFLNIISIPSKKNLEINFNDSLKYYSSFDLVIYFYNSLRDNKDIKIKDELIKEFFFKCEQNIISILTSETMKNNEYESYLKFLQIFKNWSKFYDFLDYSNLLLQYKWNEEINNDILIFN